MIGGGANTLKYFRTFQVFVEILNGNNVRKCEKKSASFTVYVVLCETNCTNEVKAHFRWVRPQRRSCRCTLLRSRKATERSSSWEVVFWKVRCLQTEKNCDAVQKKGLISALFEARWSCKSWGLITSHEVTQRNRTQRYDLSVLKWHPHTPFCLFTLGCNMKSLFSIRHCSNVPEQPGSTGRTHGPLEKSVSNYVVYETSIVSLIAEGAAGGFTSWLWATARPLRAPLALSGGFILTCC